MRKKLGISKNHYGLDVQNNTLFYIYAHRMKCSGHELRNAQKNQNSNFREKYLHKKRRQYRDLCQAIYEPKTF